MQTGLWVESGDPGAPLTGRPPLERLLDDAEQAGIRSLYVQVVKRGEAWCEAEVLGRSKAGEVSRREDHFRELIEGARERGMKVHAWINLFFLGTDRKALSEWKDEFLTVDSNGVRVDAYTSFAAPPGSAEFSLDTPGLWLDPASDEVQERLLGVVTSISRNYPELSGVHLDYVRYPYALPIRPSSGIPWGIDYGYTEGGLAAFRKAHGVIPPVLNRRGPPFSAEERAVLHAWDRWRRGRITRFVTKVRSGINQDHLLTAAVLPWIERAFMSAYQNWPDWIEREILDQACLMNYTADDELFALLLKGALGAASREKIVSGIGAWLLGAQQIAVQQMISERLGVHETILFSYGNLRTAAKFGDIAAVLTR